MISTLSSRLITAIVNSMQRSFANVAPFLTIAALMSIAGQIGFYFIWTYVFPQPYENFTLRLLGALIAVPLVFWRRWPVASLPFRPLYFHLVVLYHLPFIFLYFLVRNDFTLIWVLSSLGAAFVLTFLIEWRAVGIFYLLGALGWKSLEKLIPPEAIAPELTSYMVVLMFPLSFGSMFSYQLTRYRESQQVLHSRIRKISDENTRMISEQNQLFSLFVSNSIVSRLRQFQAKFGLEKAISMITRQEQRFCGIMEADIRNFTQMLGQQSEQKVAQLISRCFRDITSVGQDLSVIKPVGDSLFIYTDDSHGREMAVTNVLALAILFVQSLEEINRIIILEQGAPLNFGIAVHAGNAVYGNLASDTLIDPTIIGLNVNLTARLEELTKAPALQNIIGPNAILITPEAATYCHKLVGRHRLMSIDLPELGLAVRDFPKIDQIFALSSASAATLSSTAAMHVRMQRDKLATSSLSMEAGSYHDIPYYYELQGSGPDTSRTILIDFGNLSVRTLEEYAAGHLSDMVYDIQEGDTQRIVLSTANTPGRYDEHDVEMKVRSVIREMEPLLTAARRRSAKPPPIARA